MTDAILRAGASGLIPEESADSIIKEAPKASMILSNPLVTRKTMSRKQEKMPITAFRPIAYWVDPSDTGEIGVSKMEWAKKEVFAEKMGVIVPIPIDVFDDTDFDVWGEVVPEIVTAIGAKVDSTILFGVDAPAAFPDAISDGCDATDHEVKAGDTIDFGEDVNQAMGKVEDDGMAVSGHVARGSVKRRLRGLRATDGQPIYNSGLREGGVGDIHGESVRFSENGAWSADKADLITGDWKQLIVAIRKDMTFKMLDQAVVGDINLATEDYVAMKVTFRMGWQIANPPTLENPDDATRYPFAAVRPATWVGSAGVVS